MGLRTPLGQLTNVTYSIDECCSPAPKIEIYQIKLLFLKAVNHAILMNLED
jgi:hypothetical protein